jgi:hypothetical protein
VGSRDSGTVVMVESPVMESSVMEVAVMVESSVMERDGER